MDQEDLLRRVGRGIADLFGVNVREGSMLALMNEISFAGGVSNSRAC